MTDNEIIKALECCTSEDFTCNGCPYIAVDMSGAEYDCSYYARKDALDLIKRQQAEIKHLKDGLQTLIDIIESGASSNEPVFEPDIIKAEAIKEFADEFDKVLAEMRDAYFEDDHVSYGLVCETVHARLSRFTKEMVGADND